MPLMASASPSTSTLLCFISFPSIRPRRSPPYNLSAPFCSSSVPSPLRSFSGSAGSRSGLAVTKAVAGDEEQAIAPESSESYSLEEGEREGKDAPVAVHVSPSDVLTMFFKAEGTINESVIPAVTEALKGQEGVSDLVVKVAEGIGSVELTKQTTIQATGMASNLVEVIQGSGFKLQSLSLSFKDEEDAVI